MSRLFEEILKINKVLEDEKEEYKAAHDKMAYYHDEIFANPSENITIKITQRGCNEFLDAAFRILSGRKTERKGAARIMDKNSGHRMPELLSTVHELPEILKTMKKVSTTPYVYGNKSPVRQMEYYEVPIKINGKTYTVNCALQDRTDDENKRYYFHTLKESMRGSRFMVLVNVRIDET